VGQTKPIAGQFIASESAGAVSTLLLRPRDARALLLLAHGAGAGMRHRFMERIADELAGRGIATLRYQFPFMEAGGRRPDRRALLLKTISAAVAAATEQARDLPVFAGGKSMGGRMTSLACAEAALAGVRGIVFIGFPLHPSGRPANDRAEHLGDVAIPMLFLQGTRDKLAELELIQTVAAQLGEAATLHVVDGADHGFQVLKRSGRSDDSVFEELSETTENWIRARLEPAGGG